MSVETRNLRGARASSAVRCITKAQHEALGTPRDDSQQAWLEKHFRRGVNVGRAWATGMDLQLASGGHQTELEAEIPWGPGWVGHADLLDLTDKVVFEAYHAAGGAFREVKALQAALYADSLGPDWGAELAVIDTTDVSDEDGFAVQGYEINVDGLRDRVRDIKQRVIAAVEAGVVNMDDRVGDSPHHQECASCVFKQACWANWRPRTPDEVPGLEASFEALRITESDLHHKTGDLAATKARRDALREELREFLPAGIPVVSGGTMIRRTEVAGRVSVKLGDFRKAGYEIPPELEPFVTEGAPSERWKVDPVA